MSNGSNRHDGVSRRTILRMTAGGALAGGVVSFAGVAKAESGEQRYILHTNRGVARRIEDVGFEVTHSLADETVLIVVGAEDERDALTNVNGVRGVALDFSMELGDTIASGIEFDSRSPVSGGGAGTPPTLWDFQWEKPRIGIPEVHDIATGAGTKIAIIDTGIQPGHPDLENLNEDESVAFIEGERIDAGEPVDASVFSHGTMVAGIAAARGNGILGTAPDAELISIRVFSPAGTTTFADVLLATEYAADIGADVANLSLGTVPLPPQVNAGGIRAAEERVANHAVRDGTAVVYAAGNSATNLQQGGQVVFGASMAGTVAVSATGVDELLTFYSNYGTNVIDVAAPGGGMVDRVESYCGILEFFLEGRIADPGEETQVCFLEPDDVFPILVPPDVPGAECFSCTTSEYPFPLNAILTTFHDPATGEHGYEWNAGTSFAAPHVAGLVALVRELEPDMNPRRVMDAIMQGAEGATGRSDPEFGAGHINALTTVERVGS